MAEIRKAIVEERHIDRDKAARLSLGELIHWYHQLPEVQAKKSWKRDIQLLDSILRLLGENTLGRSGGAAPLRQRDGRSPAQYLIGP